MRIRGIVFVVAALLAGCGGRKEDGPAGPVLEPVGSHGEVYRDLGGTKGVVLCFHGAGGSAEGWTKNDKLLLLEHLRSEGYSFVCPTSVDRASKQWDATNAASNPDVENVDALLDELGVAEGTKLFLVGHSNGGGFTSRYSLLSSRRPSVAAIQLSNAAGLQAALSHAAYVFPTLFNYADCDPVVDAAEVRANQDVLAAKSPPVPVGDNDLDPVYEAGGYSDCHEFVSTPATTTSFFDAY